MSVQTMLGLLGQGFLTTLSIFFLTLIGSLPLGLLVYFGKKSRLAPLRWVVNDTADILDFDAPLPAKPYVIMVVGVNGVGKTTTIGKLAYQYKKAGKKVYLGAADTFRAAAVEQLCIWGERVGAGST